MQVDLEVMHPAEDSNLRMASLTAAPHDPGCASAHASGHSSDLPSLWWGPRGLFPPLLLMFVGSGGMAGGRGGPSLRDIKGGILELLVGGLLQAGGGFLSRCGQFGSTGTRSSSGVSPHRAMPLYTPLRGFIFLGIEAAYSSRIMYPCYDRPCCHAFHELNENWGHSLGCIPPSHKKLR